MSIYRPAQSGYAVLPLASVAPTAYDSNFITSYFLKILQKSCFFFSFIKNGKFVNKTVVIALIPRTFGSLWDLLGPLGVLRTFYFKVCLLPVLHVTFWGSPGPF